MHFEVCKFTTGALNEALANEWIQSDQVARSQQARYLFRYLSSAEIATKIMLVEHEYIDGDYLEDYTTYYSTCFEPYRRYCKRLHFFAHDFEDGELEALIKGTRKAKLDVLKASYRGFIVARPLPESIIGRTILATYTDDKGRRLYPAIRHYEPNLYGIRLPINSLAFQEQDSVVAACATVALWSAFHKTHLIFGTPRPRPATITRNANLVRSPGRALPSNGLRSEQVGEAVRLVGLEPEYFSVDAETPLISLIYAYLSAGIPVILGVYIEGLGDHAVSVVGYSLRDRAAPFTEPETAGVKSIARRIDKLFVHDDGLGPFARVNIVSPDDAHDSTKQQGFPTPLILSTDWEWKNEAGELLRRRHFVPWMVMIPVYGKIRVTFLNMHEWLRRLNRFFANYASPLKLRINSLEWDLRLTNVNDYKEVLRKRSDRNSRRIMTRPLPRFLWLATLRHRGTPILELVADATDMERSFPIIDRVWFDKRLGNLVQFATGLRVVTEGWRDVLRPRFYDFLQLSDDALDERHASPASSATASYG